MREAFLCTTVWTVESGQKEMISDFQAYLSKNKVYLYLLGCANKDLRLFQESSGDFRSVTR